MPFKAFTTYRACPSSLEKSCSLESSALSRISHLYLSSCFYFSTKREKVYVVKKKRSNFHALLEYNNLQTRLLKTLSYIVCSL